MSRRSSDGGRAERLYGMLLGLSCPPGFVAEAGEEMVAVFRPAWQAARSAGASARRRFWIRTTMDLASTGASEWAAVFAGLAREVGMLGRSPGRDMALAARTLRRAPAHALLSAATLGMGLLAVVSVFSIVRSVLLRPLDLDAPERIVRLYEQDGGTRYFPSYPNVVDWRERTRTLSALVPFSYPEVLPVRLPRRPERLSVAGAGRGFLTMLGVRPALGRPMADDENRPGGAPVALVSHALWSGPLGRAPLDGLVLGIGDELYAVVGVLPSGFELIDEVDVWTPLERHPETLGPRGSHGYHVLGRLAPGRTLADAASEMGEIHGDLRVEYGEATTPSVRVFPFQEQLVAGVRRPLILLLVAAALVYVVACLNLGSAILARGFARSGDLAVRLALGAGRVDLVRHVMAETSVAALPGAALGVAGAAVVLDAVRRNGTGLVPRLGELTMDGTVVAVALGLAALAVVVAGAGPALVLSGRNVADRLRGVNATAERTERRRLWHAFLALQVGLTVVLLVSSGLLLKSMRSALSVDLGYDPHGVLVADVSLPEERYPDGQEMIAYYEEALERLSALPGVAAAGLANVLPDETQTIITWGRPDGADDDVHAWTGYRLVDDGFFQALRIPTTATVPPPPSDSAAPAAALLSRSLADRLWNGSDAVGARFDIGGGAVGVAGLTGNVREWWQEDGMIGMAYLDYRTDPGRGRAMHLVVRASPGSDVESLVASVRAALRSVDPEVPATLASFEERVRRALADRRLSLAVLGAFAAAALLLASVAVYGAVSYAAARRTREAGIRIALGARPSELGRFLALRGLVPVLVGVGVGAAASALATPLLRAQLFGVQPTDPWVLVSAPVVLLAVAAVASYLPARRATRVDPVRALRSEG